jgi:hypothetical protein
MNKLILFFISSGFYYCLHSLDMLIFYSELICDLSLWNYVDPIENFSRKDLILLLSIHRGSSLTWNHFNTTSTSSLSYTHTHIHAHARTHTVLSVKYQPQLSP